MITLSTGKRSAGDFPIDGDRRGVDGAAEARRVQLQRLDLAVAEHRGHRPPVHQLDAFLEHVVEIFGHARHLAGRGLDGDDRHFLGALAQRFARAVDRGIAAADDGDARPQLHLRRAHADVAEERQPVDARRPCPRPRRGRCSARSGRPQGRTRRSSSSGRPSVTSLPTSVLVLIVMPSSTRRSISRSSTSCGSTQSGMPPRLSPPAFGDFSRIVTA